MSFLHIVVPVETTTDLVKDIQKQLEVGRLNVTAGSLDVVENPTRELKRLVSFFEAELKVRLKNYGFVQVTKDDAYEIEAESNVFCLQRFGKQDPIWFDMLREHRFEGMSLLRCEEGELSCGEGGEGGIFLVMLDSKLEVRKV
ncbi:MAG: hypothetical protein M1837_000197 [Sclerophora amabilis]|nr:MAG: hypothetical protein M1837_000197 [Sclerophora amabilis]